MSTLDASLELAPNAAVTPLETERRPTSSAELESGTVSIPELTSGTPVCDAAVLQQSLTEDKESFPEQVPSPASVAPLDDATVPFLSKRQERIYLATSIAGALILGWSDGSTGPLILRMEANYNIGYAVVSLLFPAAFVGFAFAALLTVPLTDRLGFGKTMVLGAALEIVGFAVEAAAPPWPVFVVAYAVNGFAVAIMGAQVNAFVACLPGGNWKLQLLHAGYGVGALLSPLAATQLVQTRHWSFPYLIAGCMAVVELVLICLVFRFKTQAQLLGTPVHAATGENKYRQILRIRTVHLLSFFILVYVGLEVSIGGWVVTYLVEVRGAGPSAGYVSSGFWGGLALGRLTLIWLNEKLGVKRAIFLYLTLALVLQFVIWFVPSIVGDAIAVSMMGLLLGPFYPLIVGAGQKMFPPELLTGCIGWIASFGQAGSAVFPFLTGALAQKYGITVLQPVLVAMIVAEAAIWVVIPMPGREVE